MVDELSAVFVFPVAPYYYLRLALRGHAGGVYLLVHEGRTKNEWIHPPIVNTSYPTFEDAVGYVLHIKKMCEKGTGLLASTDLPERSD